MDELERAKRTIGELLVSCEDGRGHLHSEKATTYLEKVFTQVRDEERERCAKIVENKIDYWNTLPTRNVPYKREVIAKEIATAIRRSDVES